MGRRKEIKVIEIKVVVVLGFSVFFGEFKRKKKYCCFIVCVLRLVLGDVFWESWNIF